ncbi:exonuclease subunit SbcD [Vibrio sp. CK2-1]|uniref:exonuclease subunit SbcD n=1 Tax=Vibrio sp. CK2-1 TaxID=2912249 RepID=UPI001F00D315|nr:exonuclease subunit SbcD [Vibrio sp. CK2-1]MCF7353299.1 exonuclease subunit SbcD [Vibrio sp. CK2-1]
MKIIHTSDWHLGQNFFTKSRKNEHQAFIDWLLELVKAQQVDAVIIAGDVFDTGTPPSYAREMYNRFVVKLSQLGTTLIVLGGNHDSVSMLNESKDLLACLNTHVIANTSENLSEQVILLEDRHKQAGAILCAVPFIRPRDVLQSVAGETSTQKKQALGEAIQQHYQDLHDKALEIQSEQQQKLKRKLPIIATGHLTALGVTTSESVRDIYIGSLEAFDAKAFPPVDYIALGHIHRPQIVAKSESIRYCGSPIPLSFDEIKTKTIEADSSEKNQPKLSNKQVVLVEFNEDGKRIEPLPIPLFQSMMTLKGSLESIESQLQQFVDIEQTVWLCIHVEVDDYLSDLQPRIQAMTENLNVEVLQLRRSRSQQAQSLTQVKNETLAELTPQDVFHKRMSLESFEGEEAEVRQQRIMQQFDQVVSDVLEQQSGNGDSSNKEVK